MMVAAFVGRRGSATLTSWASVALLLGATVALIGAAARTPAPSSAG